MPFQPLTQTNPYSLQKKKKSEDSISPPSEWLSSRKQMTRDVGKNVAEEKLLLFAGEASMHLVVGFYKTLKLQTLLSITERFYISSPQRCIRFQPYCSVPHASYEMELV